MRNYWMEESGAEFLSTKEEVVSYFTGVEAGIRAFAIWSNGDQLVGCMRRPLGEVLAEVREAFVSHLGRFAQ